MTDERHRFGRGKAMIAQIGPLFQIFPHIRRGSGWRDSPVAEAKASGDDRCFLILAPRYHSSDRPTHPERHRRRISSVDPRNGAENWSGALADSPVGELGKSRRARHLRIRAMATSLVDMFGDAALSVALGQSAGRDVGGACGIAWRDVVLAIRIEVSGNLPSLVGQCRPSSSAPPIGRPTARRSQCFGSYAI